MLQELCRSSFEKACKNVFSPLVRVRGSSTPFADFYGKYNQHLRHDWRRLPLKSVSGGRTKTGEIRSIRRKCWMYFNENADRLRDWYVANAFGYNLEKGMLESGTFDALFEGFYDCFEKRKGAFMEKVARELALKNEALAAKGKLPQSHGGVANLLKVLTKTMYQQGASIYSIAKVQYAICMQAGIYIPDEFLTDVLVANEILEGK